jgi:hypothetical protein
MAPPLAISPCPDAGRDTDELTRIVPELAAFLRPAP